ncbi:MAG: hypothetical protein HKN91_06890 [Acidimicrobiia bacterium]|nr:hypothetical protein [Acidimicrobiia bacterium]
MDDQFNEISDGELLQHDVQDLIQQVRDKRIVQRYYRHNPYIVLAAAAGLGYVAAGGLVSPFTRRLTRIGMKALFVPIAAAQFKGAQGMNEG